MRLIRLVLTQFKNYESQLFDFSGRLNCLTGLNGMGKTNVLDAIHFLCLCKSHSGLSDKHLVRHEAGFFRVEGLFESEKEKLRVAAKYASGERKEFEQNGVPVDRLSDHIGRIPVVMIAPDDVALVQEGSEDRRRFLDSTLSQMSPDYLRHLIAYSALLKQRNALLKAFFEKRQFDGVLLESIDRQMYAPAAALYAHRSAFMEKFQPHFSDFYQAISGGREAVSIQYQSDLETASLESMLVANLERDRALLRTAGGPHRDDLVMVMDGVPVKKFASQGQLKSYLLALRLAQYEVLRRQLEIRPLLLLDDIFDKLDERRVAQLIQLLIERDFGQIFITDTQRQRIEPVIASFTGDYRVFEVSEGAAVAG